MKVELLYFAGCPNRGPALEVLRRAAQVVGIDAEIEEVEIRDEAEAERLRFLGSPTLRVNGRDVEPDADGRTDFALGCRMYGGSGVPPQDLVEASLRSASGVPR
jgi:hypothetical protein